MFERTHLLLARFHHRRGNDRVAQAVLRGITKDSRVKFDATVLLASIACSQKDWALAVEHAATLERLAKLVHASPPAHLVKDLRKARVKRAEELLDAQDLSGAEAVALPLAHERPLSLAALSCLARIAFERHDWKPCIDYWSQARVLAGQNDKKLPRSASTQLREARFHHADQLIQAGDTHAAESLLAEIRQEKTSEPALLLRLARLASHKKDWSAAVEHWTAVKTACEASGESIPDDLSERLREAATHQASALRARGDWEAAYKALPASEETAFFETTARHIGELLTGPTSADILEARRILHIVAAHSENRDLKSRARNAFDAARKNTRESARLAVRYLNAEAPAFDEARRRALAVKSPEALDDYRQQAFVFGKDPIEQHILRHLSTLDAPPGPRSTVFINDTRTQNNIGCRATSTTLAAALVEIGLRLDTTITLGEVEILAPYLFKTEPASPDNFAQLLSRFKTAPVFEAYRRLLNKADHVIINGEGSFYDNSTKGLFKLVMAAYAKDEKKYVALINHSASIDHDTTRRWIAELYPRLDFISFREHQSPAQLLHHGISGRYVTAADAAFTAPRNAAFTRADCWRYAQLHPDELLGPSGPLPERYVIVSGSSGICRADRPRFDHQETLKILLREIAAAGFAPVLFAADGGDNYLLRPLAGELRLPLISASLQPEILLPLLEGAVAFISGRWHASILAATVGTPCLLGEANFFKTTALHEILGYPWPMFSYLELDRHVAPILTALKTIDHDRDHWRNHTLERARAQAQLFRDSIRQLSESLLQASEAAR